MVLFPKAHPRRGGRTVHNLHKTNHQAPNKNILKTGNSSSGGSSRDTPLRSAETVGYPDPE